MKLAQRIVKSIKRTLFVLNWPIDAYKDWSKRRICIAHDDAKFLKSALVANHRGDPALLSVGRGSVIAGRLEVFAHGGAISLGEYCFVGENTRIWSADSIAIGDRVLISHDVNILDWNTHSISAAERHEHFLDIINVGHPASLSNVPAAAISIDDDAWIGSGVTVLKGVRIGKGAVIGAASVITKDVLPYEIVVGNPQRVVGHAKI